MASVLITGTSKGMGFEGGLGVRRGGSESPRHYAQSSQSPELAQTIARENLPGREWILAAPVSRRIRCSSLPAMTQSTDGRRVGELERKRRRDLVPSN